MPIWRSALCFVFGVALIVSAVWSPAVILSGDRAVFILVAWVVIGAYLIVRAYTSRLRVTKECWTQLEKSLCAPGCRRE
jgi:hypothetical protein